MDNSNRLPAMIRGSRFGNQRAFLGAGVNAARTHSLASCNNRSLKED